MSIRYVISVLVPALSLFVARAAFADEPSPPNVGPAQTERLTQPARSAKPDRFSRAGRVVLPKIVGASLTNTVATGVIVDGGGLVSFSTGLGGTSKQITVNPIIDVFVTDHLTLGANVRFAHRTVLYPALPSGVVGITGYDVFAGPRLGATFELGGLTIWPKVSVGYGRGRSVSDATGIAPASRSLTGFFEASASIDVVVPLGRNALISLGPTLVYRSLRVEGSGAALAMAPSQLLPLSTGAQANLGLTF